eukprot:6174269-Pleurochrysis_carterae.AAC.4
MTGYTEYIFTTNNNRELLLSAVVYSSCENRPRVLSNLLWHCMRKRVGKRMYDTQIRSWSDFARELEKSTTMITLWLENEQQSNKRFAFMRI